MRKKLYDFKREMESQARKLCGDMKLDYYGINLE
jgi:hypothetical protein